MAKTLSLRFKDTPEDQATARVIVEALRDNFHCPKCDPDGIEALIEANDEEDGA